VFRGDFLNHAQPLRVVKNKMKLFLVARDEWTTKDKNTGEEISGLSYIGYLPSGKALKFTSLEDYPVYMGEVEYDPARAQELNLLTSFFGGNVKYKDGASYGKAVETV